MTFKTLSDLLNEDASGKAPLENKVVLLRVDYNVPRKGEKILDSSRLEATIPTLLPLLERGAKVIALSHFGRPKGKKDLSLSLAFLLPLLSSLLHQKVFFHDDQHETPLEDFVKKAPPGSFILLENLRFHPEEESNDEAFARSLATLGDLYINDAFSASHRSHASVVALPSFLPSYAGTLFEKENDLVFRSIKNPQRPLMALVAGAKVSTKLALLDSLIEKADKLVLGGGIANTFLVAKGISMGDSLVETSMIETAKRILDKAPEKGCDLILPEDFLGAKDLEAASCVFNPISGEGFDESAGNLKALDIGPTTIKLIEKALTEVKTVLWNGPLGVFETPPFDQGTRAIAKAVASLTRAGKLTSIVGGGETAAAMTQIGVKNDLSGLSLSGGAFLEALQGKILPGVQALHDACS